MLSGIWPAAASFVLCLLAIVALRPIAVAVDLIDRPGGRKSHHGNVPIVGGLAMFLGVSLGVGLVSTTGSSGTVFLAAAALLVTVGLLDDRFELSPGARLPVQIAAALVLMLGAGAAVVTLGAPFGTGAIELEGLASHVFTVLAIVGAINAFNMLDGMDGLAGMAAVVALSALGFFSYAGGFTEGAVFCAVVVGAVGAFLIFNLPMRLNRGLRCFMGDGGSSLLGIAVAWMCIQVSQQPKPLVAPVTVLWVVALPLFELFWTVLRRIIRGVSPFRADNDHFHHLLLRSGIGVRGAFTVFLALSTLLALTGVLLERAGVSQSLSFALLVAAGVAVVRLMYVIGRFWRYVPEPLRRMPPLDHVESFGRVEPIPLSAEPVARMPRGRRRTRGRSSRHGNC